jgi:hypothetical protein
MLFYSILFYTLFNFFRISTFLSQFNVFYTLSIALSLSVRIHHDRCLFLYIFVKIYKTAYAVGPP